MIIRKKQKGIFHIGGKDTLSPFQMALETAKHFGLDESLVEEVITGDFPQPAKRPMRTGLLIDKARKLLGYEPHSFREGLEIIKQQISGTQRQ
jgi:dTDP-4-dehydrorhamnose reductase